MDAHQNVLDRGPEGVVGRTLAQGLKNNKGSFLIFDPLDHVIFDPLLTKPFAP